MARTSRQSHGLRQGFTTGTAAAAAAKAALWMLVKGRTPSSVDIRLLTGEPITIPVEGCRRVGKAVRCTVIKDAGDDPDVTHKARIGATVSLEACGCGVDPESRVVITGGKGVGTVTKPGLEIPPGEPAINPGPRRMIREAVADVLAGGPVNQRVRVEVFAPDGKALAERTLNARLGILGGLSILGTTGRVNPMSHEAYIATIRSAMAVAWATGNRKVVLTTGRRSERYAQALLPLLPEEAFVQIGDFFQMSLAHAAKIGFSRATLAVFFGKAVKMAQGAAHTHAAKADLTLAQLSIWTLEATGDRSLAGEIRGANTARHALELLRGADLSPVERVGRAMVAAAGRFAGPGIRIGGVIFDYDGGLLYRNDL